MVDLVKRQATDLKLMKAFLENAKDQSNLFSIYVENMHIGTDAPQDSLITEQSIRELILRILALLPEPRLQNLKDLVLKVATEKFNYDQSKASRYLGMKSNYLANIKKRKENKEDDENNS